MAYSGHSGSMQSSTGGGGDEEEYDSRAVAETMISPFLNPNSLSFGLSISNHHRPSPPQPPPAPLSHHHNHPATFFDPLLQILPPFSHDSTPNPNPNTLYDSVWSTSGLRSEPNYITGSSSSAQSLIGPSGGPFRSPPNSGQTKGAKSSKKKRTRASRRAPTTVLSTDPTNFRQMVQEFTGVPSPPFSAAQFSFGGGSSVRSGHLDSLGQFYPFRPLGTIATSISAPSSVNQLHYANMQNPTNLSVQNLGGFLRSQGNSTIPSFGELGVSGQENLSANLGGFPRNGDSFDENVNIGGEK